MNEQIKKQIMEELEKLIDYMISDMEEVYNKMKEENINIFSKQWSTLNGKFLSMSRVTVESIMTKFRIEKLLEQMPN